MALTTWAPMLSSFVVTVWAVALGVFIARWWGGVPRWLPAAAGAAGALMVALPMVGHLRVLRDPLQRASERLGAALWLQAAALVIAAVALGVSGWTQVVAWVCVGTAAVAAGRWATARPVAGFGLIVLAIAIGRVLVWEMWFSGVRRVGVDLLGLHWTQWAALAALTAAGCGVSAWLLVRDWTMAAVENIDPPPANEAAHVARLDAARTRFGPQWRRVAIALLSVAVLLAMLALGHEASEGLAVTIAWALLAVAVVALRRVMPAIATALVIVAMAVVAISIGRAFMVESWRAGAPVAGAVVPAGFDIVGLHLTAWSGIALVNAAACAFLAIVSLGRAAVARLEAEAAFARASLPRRDDGPWRVAAIVAAAAATGLTMLSVSNRASAGLPVIAVWLGVAIGLTFMRRVAPRISTALLFIAMAVTTVSVVRSFAWEPFTPAARAVGLDLAGLRVSMWSAMNLLNAAACVYFALRLLEMSRTAALAGDGIAGDKPDKPFATSAQWRACAMVAGAIATLLVAATVFGDNEIGVAEVIAFMVLAALLALIGRVVPLVRPLRPDVHAIVVLAVAVLAWFGVFVIGGWESFDDPAALHRGLGLAILLSVEIAWLAQSTRLSSARADEPAEEVAGPRSPLIATLRRLVPDPAALPDFKDPLGPDGLLRVCGILVPLLLLFVASSLEVARVAKSIADDATVRGAAVSGWWGALAIGLLYLGFRRRNAICRRIGLGLLALATLKALIFDTASVSTGWRAVSLVGLGLLMLGVGVAYSRLSKREQENEAGDERGVDG